MMKKRATMSVLKMAKMIEHESPYKNSKSYYFVHKIDQPLAIFLIFRDH